MKTTIEIADDLFRRAQALARKEKITFRALTEEGLRLVLIKWQNTQRKLPAKKLPPLVTVNGEGLTDKFKHAPWKEIRDEAYGHGA